MAFDLAADFVPASFVEEVDRSAPAGSAVVEALVAAAAAEAAAAVVEAVVVVEELVVAEVEDAYAEVLAAYLVALDADRVLGLLVETASVEVEAASTVTAASTFARVVLAEE